MLGDDIRFAAARRRGSCGYDIACCAAIIVLCGAFFRTVLFSPGHVLYYERSDLVHFLIPQVTFVIDSFYGDGRLPLWEPFAYCGKPPYAVPQLGVFYPFFLLVLLSRSMSAYGYLFAIHFVVAGLGTYLFIREISGRRRQAFFSAVVFMFCGYMSARVLIGQYWHLCAISWIPFLFFFAERFAARAKLLDAVLLGAAMAMQFLAGHTQYLLYTLAALFPYLAFRMIAGPGRVTLRGIARIGSALGLTAVLFFLLSAVQLFPVVEYAPYAYRANMHDLGVASTFSLLPGDLPTLVFPNLRGSAVDFSYWGVFSFWEVCAYMGLVPLTLVLFSLFLCRDRYWAFFAFLLVCSLLFSMGMTFPLFPLLWRHLPGFNLFRCPSRMLALYSFSLAVVSGYGLSAACDGAGSRRVRRLALCFLILWGASLVGIAVLAAWKDAAVAAGKGIVAFVFNLDRDGPHTRSLAEWQALVAPHYEKIRRALLSPWQLVNLAAACGFCALLRLRRSRPALIFTASCAASLIDLWSLGLPMVAVKPAREINPQGPITAFLLRDRDLFRVHDRGGGAPIEETEPAGIFSVTGFESTFLKHYIEFLACVEQDMKTRLGINGFDYEMRNFRKVTDIPFEQISLLADNLNFLDLLNVKYIITPQPVCRPGLELVLTAESSRNIGRGPPHQVYVYLNRNRLPRAFVVGEAVAARGSVESLKAIKTNDPRQCVVLESPAGVMRGGCAFQEAAVTRYSPDRIDVEARLGAPGYLVLSEVWYPGWHATDGSGFSLPVLRVNRCMRGVCLGKGEHRISFEYRPRSYAIGRRMSLAGIGLFCLLLCIGFISRMRERGRLSPAEK